MNLGWESGNHKQGYAVCISPWQWWNHEVIFSKYLYHYGAGKCPRNVNFEEMDTEDSAEKNYGFWVLWGRFKEYIKQNIIIAVLRKANSHSVAICRLIKKSIMKKKIQWEKLTQPFVFLKLPSANEVLMRSNVMQCMT